MRKAVCAEMFLVKLNSPGEIQLQHILDCTKDLCAGSLSRNIFRFPTDKVDAA